MDGILNLSHELPIENPSYLEKNNKRLIWYLHYGMSQLKEETENQNDPVRPSTDKNMFSILVFEKKEGGGFMCIIHLPGCIISLNFWNIITIWKFTK